jgi:ABC-type Mn2+/Zn2+ transport system ATPase subunit
MDNLLCKERPRVKRWSRIKLLQLSGGEFKAAIIAAYAANRSLAGMILDEPLAGMAPEAQVKVLAFLCCTAKARHIPIMLTSVLREPRPSLDEAIADGRISKLPTLADQADLDNIPVMEN